MRFFDFLRLYLTPEDERRTSWSASGLPPKFACSSKLCLFGREWCWCEFIDGHAGNHRSHGLIWETIHNSPIYRAWL